MRKSRRAASVVALAGVFALAVASPAFAAVPRNDDFNTPRGVHHIPHTFTENTSNATTQTGEPQATFGTGSFVLACTTSGYDQTVWFTFKPASDVTVQIDTAGSYLGGTTDQYDTALALWTYNGSTFTEVDCNDDVAFSTYTSYLDDALTGGTTYYIQVGSFGSDVFSDAHLVLNIYT